MAEAHRIPDNVDGLPDEFVEGVLGLLTQILAIAPEQHALHPQDVDQRLAQGNVQACLARAGGLPDSLFVCLRNTRPGIWTLAGRHDADCPADDPATLAARVLCAVHR